MKNLRKLAGICIFFILVFMVIALFQFERKGENESISLLPDQIEYHFNEDWIMVSVDHAKLSETELSDHEKLRELIEKELAGETYKKVTLPNTGESKALELIVFKNV